MQWRGGRKKRRDMRWSKRHEIWHSMRMPLVRNEVSPVTWRPLHFRNCCLRTSPLQKEGYINVGDKWMLVTLSWWQFLDVSDRILILVTSFGCWCPMLMLKNKGCWWLKRSKPSLSCRQHISSPTSVTNIDVAQNETLSWTLVRPSRYESVLFLVLINDFIHCSNFCHLLVLCPYICSC